MTRRTRVDIFTDGACRGNPGPGGWCAILRTGPSEKTLSGATGRTTNNRMELTAALEGLRALKRPCAVRLVSDSQYVTDGMKEWVHGWIRRGWRRAKNQPVVNEDLWRALVEAAAEHDVEWVWVRGHSGHPENERCDRVANQAIDAMLAGRDA